MVIKNNNKKLLQKIGLNKTLLDLRGAREKRSTRLHRWSLLFEGALLPVWCLYVKGSAVCGMRDVMSDESSQKNSPMRSASAAVSA